jgi:hypothetical protein
MENGILVQQMTCGDALMNIYWEKYFLLRIKNRGPFLLIYYEACLNEQDAKGRERYLKSGMGKRYLKNRLKRFLSLTGLARG